MLWQHWFIQIKNVNLKWWFLVFVLLQALGFGTQILVVVTYVLWFLFELKRSVLFKTFYYDPPAASICAFLEKTFISKKAGLPLWSKRGAQIHWLLDLVCMKIFKSSWNIRNWYIIFMWIAHFHCKFHIHKNKRAGILFSFTIH